MKAQGGQIRAGGAHLGLAQHGLESLAAALPADSEDPVAPGGREGNGVGDAGAVSLATPCPRFTFGESLGRKLAGGHVGELD